jgi:hypothetical protein
METLFSFLSQVNLFGVLKSFNLTILSVNSVLDLEQVCIFVPEFLVFFVVSLIATIASLRFLR